MSVRHVLAVALTTVLATASLASVTFADDEQITTASGDKPVVPTLGAATVFRDDEILATVNGRPIPAVSLENVLRQLDDGETPADRERILAELIDMEVLAQAAELAGLDRNPEVASALMLQYTQTLANAFIAEQNATFAVSEDDLRTEYDRQVSALPTSEYRLAHILVETEEQAEAIIVALEAGESFEALANEESIDSNGENGGAIGWLSSGSMLPEMAAAVADMQSGQTSEAPVQSSFGWHIIRIEDSRRAALPDFEAVRPGIEGLLVRRMLAKELATLREAADVEIRSGR